MNRKLRNLAYPTLLAATVASMSANAAGGGFSTPSSGIPSSSLTPSTMQSSDSNRMPGLGAEALRGSGDLTTISNRVDLKPAGSSRLADRSALPGLDDTSALNTSKSSKSNAVPDVQLSKATGDGSVSRTLTVSGNNGSLKASGGIDHSGTTLKGLAQQSGSSDPVSHSNATQLTSDVQASRSRSGSKGSSQSAFNNESTTKLSSSGTLTPATSSSPSSSSSKRMISSQDNSGYQLSRSGSSLSGSGSDSSSKLSRDTTSGFSDSSSTSRQGLKLTDRSQSFQPDFKTSGSQSGS